MTKYGETEHFHTCDFIKTIENFIGRTPQGVIYNSTRPPEAVLNDYKKTNSNFVEPDRPQLSPEFSSKLSIDKKLRNDYTVYKADILRVSQNTVRHDSEKLSALLKKIIDGIEHNER